MTYVEKQNEFSHNISLLILKAQELGFLVTQGEAERSKELQLVYFHSKEIIEQGGTIQMVDCVRNNKITRRSTTMNSKHLVRKAMDLHFFKEIDGKLTYINGLTKPDGSTDKVRIVEILKPIGDFWESLHPDNRWGGHWNFFDSPHFEQNN